MKRATMFTWLIAALGALPALAQGPTGGSTTVTRSVVTRRETAIGALLRKRIDAVDWDHEPFQNVLNWLKEQGEGRINIIPRWRALEIVGADADTPITLSLRDSTVRQILTEVLSQLGGAEGETDPVQFHFINNTLTVSTRSDFNRKMYVRVYDVTDLILQVPNFRDAPAIDLTQQTGGGGGGGGGGGENIFGGGRGGGGGGDEDQQGGGGQGDQQYKLRMDALIELIKASIEPDTWEIANAGAYGGSPGGGKGTIVPFNRFLIVRNTIEVHEQLGGSFD
ncbi:MAG TPA: hypothetical protein VGM03_08000 [Phycisphaerae bacterium]